MKTGRLLSKYIHKCLATAVLALFLACGSGDASHEDIFEDTGSTSPEIEVQICSQANVSGDNPYILRVNLAFFLNKEDAQEAMNTGCGEAYHTVQFAINPAEPGSSFHNGSTKVRLPGDRYYYVIAFGDYYLKGPGGSAIRAFNDCLDEGEVFSSHVETWFWNQELAIDVEDARKAKLENVFHGSSKCFDLDGGTCNNSNPPPQDVHEPEDTSTGTDTNISEDTGGTTVNGNTTFEVDGAQFSAQSTTMSGSACWLDGNLFGKPGHSSAQILEVVNGSQTKGVVIDLSLDINNTSLTTPVTFEDSRNSFSITVHADGTEYSSLNVPVTAEFDPQVIITQWDGTTGAGTFSGHLYETSGSEPVYVTGTFSADM